VIKVEEPRSGDPVREAPPFVAGESALAGILLAGVESLALDLKRRAARDVLHDWLARADVLVESFRPGTLARLGLDPEELRERYPRLVLCSVSGWGQDGPWATRAGHDLSYQAVAGVVGTTGAMPPAPTADVLGAWSATASILAALLERERTGEGVWLDVSLTDAAVHSNLAAWASVAGGPGARGVGLSGTLPCYRLYETADGELLAVACLEERFWRGFCDAAGRDDLRPLQYDVSEEAHRRVARAIRQRSLAEWTERLSGFDLPVEPIATPALAARHPQVEARGVLASDDRARPRLRFPVRFGRERPGAGGPLPDLGQDTERLLEEIGSPFAEMRSGERKREGVGRRGRLRSWLRRKILERRTRSQD
jgi:crotonobetainyl-CoA:carnitine CoA-transferase CaiB-like acyl-CoA transferase